MSEQKENRIYKISFLNHDNVVEMYAKHVGESDMFGFIEIESLIFGENSSIVVDPGEERLKMEFTDVKRTYVPMHSIIRIDEVSKHGVAKMTETQVAGNVKAFPAKPLHFREE